MAEKNALFWPCDGRGAPNDLALPSITGATQLESLLSQASCDPAPDTRYLPFVAPIFQGFPQNFARI